MSKRVSTYIFFLAAATLMLFPGRPLRPKGGSLRYEEPTIPVGTTGIYTVLKASPVVNGLSLMGNHYEADNEPMRVAGKDCWVANPTDLPEKYFYFKVDSQEYAAGAMPIVTIAMEYFDLGQGNVDIKYDSSDQTVLDAPVNPGAYKKAGSFTLSDSRQWKTVTFEIDDALFSKRCNTADIRVGCLKDATLICSKFMIYKTKRKKVAKATIPRGKSQLIDGLPNKGKKAWMLVDQDIMSGGMTVKMNSADSRLVYTNVDGVRALGTREGLAGVERFIYVDVRDPKFTEGKRPEVVLLIEYYDAGHYEINIKYDSSDANVEEVPQYPGAFKTTDSMIRLANSMQWRIAAIQVPDAYLANRCNEADFRLGIPNGKDFNIKSLALLPHSAGSKFELKADGMEVKEKKGYITISTSDPEDGEKKRFKFTGPWQDRLWIVPTEGAKAEWTPKLPREGSYHVEIWYSDDPNQDHARDARFVVHHADGEAEYFINLRTEVMTWKRLGTFYFKKGWDGLVELDASRADGNIIANKVRFIDVKASEESK